MKSVNLDIVVLGSGFAGSIAAMILQRTGRSVAMIDKSAHPRFAIGESSTPIANMVLRDLAIRYDLPRLLPLATFGTWQQAYPNLGCGLKRGFSYFAHELGQSFTPRDDHANELLVAASSCDRDSDTHWLRADIDHFLCSEASDLGVAVFDNCDLREIEHIGEGDWSLECQHHGETMELRALFVIDATGEAGVLPRALGVKSSTSGCQTNSRAIFSHFHGTGSWNELFQELGGDTSDHPFNSDNAAQHHVFDGGWLWMLRMNEALASVGLVLDAAKHPLDSAITAEAEWQSRLNQFPSITGMLAGTMIADSPGKLIRTNRLQRRWQQAAGDDWALLPHTAGFVDALHSTGIAHSLCGVERLVGILDRHRDAGARSNSLREYDVIIGQELGLIDELVGSCFAALGQFDLFIVATMVYFAAVTTYERLRCRDDASLAFLCANDDKMRCMLHSCRQRIVNCDASSESEIERVRVEVAELIAPINHVGLLNPTQMNMYRHTVAPM